MCLFDRQFSLTELMETEKPLKSWIESKVGNARVFLSTNCQIIKRGGGVHAKREQTFASSWATAFIRLTELVF